MYLGYDAEDERGRRAVEETKSEVLLDSYANYIDAYYSSSGGNYTASVSDVWGLSPRSYLLAVSDNASGSSYKSWTREFSTTEMAAKLSDLRLAEIESITVFQRSMEGRATKIQVLGQAKSEPVVAKLNKAKWHEPTRKVSIFGDTQEKVVSEPEPFYAQSHYLSGEELRHKLGLPSTNFQLSRQADKYIFNGTGFGHGIGMTQYGARNMADSGASYRDILRHYYPGAEIKLILQ